MGLWVAAPEGDDYFFFHTPNVPSSENLFGWKVGHEATNILNFPDISKCYQVYNPRPWS